jgi:predicted dehydrogenase
MIRTALVGYGYWGPNLLRNFSKHPNCEMVAVVEKRSDVHVKIQAIGGCFWETEVNNYTVKLLKRYRFN